MRIVVARRTGRRGEGLGNELVGCAKGFIASQALQARLVGPTFGLNRRKYYRNFGTSRFDFVLEELLTRLPHHAFDEEAYRATGEVDLGRALTVWADATGLAARASFIVTVDGMYGGFPAIRHARAAVQAKLLTSRDALANVYQVAATLDPRKLFVAVHMRLGKDFETLGAGEQARGRFNLHIPGEWYLHACEGLQQAFGDQVQFHFFTDRPGAAFDEAVRRFNPGQRRQSGFTECSDLLLMAQADLRICSVSSYSMMASFLADGPYLWYEPQLACEQGRYTLWGNEPAQRLPGSQTEQTRDAAGELQPGIAQELLKGWPLAERGVLASGLLAQLQRKLSGKTPAWNLLEFGSVPAWILGS